MKVWVAIALAILLVIGGGSYYKNQKAQRLAQEAEKKIAQKKAEEAQAKAEAEAQARATAETLARATVEANAEIRVQEGVRRYLKDPDSAKFGKIVVIDFDEGLHTRKCT